MDEEVKKLFKSFSIITIVRYSLFGFMAVMLVFGIFTGLDYPVWMLLILVFLVGFNVGILLKDKRNHDLTLLN